MQNVQEHSSVYLKTNLSCCQSRALPVTLHLVILCKYMHQVLNERRLCLGGTQALAFDRPMWLNLDYVQVDLVYVCHRQANNLDILQINGVPFLFSTFTQKEGWALCWEERKRQMILESRDQPPKMFWST